MASLRSRVSEREGSLRDLSNERRRASQELNRRRTQVRSQADSAVCSSSAKYLIAENTLDAGALKLYPDRLVFSGYRGTCVIPLSQVSAVNQGTSRLPRRSGIPLVGRLWPGPDREGDTLMIELVSDEDTRERCVLAGLEPGQHWPENLQTAWAIYPSFMEGRAAMAAEVQVAEHVKKIEAETSALEHELATLQSEIRALESSRRGWEDDLALPDWEHRTVRLSGANLHQQLQRTLDRAAAEGWELISTASPSQTDLIVTLRRVRRI